MNAISNQSPSVQALLERIESELQTADGRNAKVCRDANGNFWVVDAAERVVPLNEFASDCASMARQSCERERAQAMREIVTGAKHAFGRAVRLFQPSAKPVHA
jgi:hypothetical protein